MPTMALHSHYWGDKPYGAAPAATDELQQYPAWQAVVVCGSLFGAFQVLYEHYMTKRKQ